MTSRFLALFAFFCGIALFAQQAEITSTDAPVVFRSGTDLIAVPVVVRDTGGNSIGTLSVDDFRLFDNGKLQTISKFVVEKAEGVPAAESARASTADVTPSRPDPHAPEATADAIPDQYLAWLFDDLNMSVSDLTYTRSAVLRQLDTPQSEHERFAIFTTSRRETQDFTADKGKLRAALNAITARQAVSASAQLGCPPVDYYMGDLIYNKKDPAAKSVAVADAVKCGFEPDTAVRKAEEAASLSVHRGDQETESVLESLRYVLGRMSAVPGNRRIAVISPGFLVLSDKNQEQTEIIERAIRVGVVISALDARGLNIDPGMDASEKGTPSPAKLALKRSEAATQTDALALLADGTGGAFYHGTNNYDEGMTRVSTVPEYRYLLFFSPTNLRLDGSFHTLKVTLKNDKGLILQFRRGYYEPTDAAGSAGRVKQDLEDAFFSRNEIRGVPAVLQTDYFKLDNGDATLSADVGIDVKGLAFKKENARNSDDLTVIVGLFDSDGNYISGVQKNLEMRLLDATLQKLGATGIDSRQSFTVHPGRYMVRAVVRDAQGQLMSAESSIVSIQ
jgi:VWFA-related protein